MSGDCSPVVGLRRTPRRTVRRAGPLASSDPSGRSGLTRAEKRPLHPPTADRSPSPPVGDWDRGRGQTVGHAAAEVGRDMGTSGEVG